MIHTFIWAVDIVDRGGDARIILEGEAPKWLLELPDPKHGRHPLYRKVKDKGLIDAVCKPKPLKPRPRRACVWCTMRRDTSAWCPTWRQGTAL
jgi:hypothetical protein